MSDPEEQPQKPMPWESLEAKLKQLQAIVDAPRAAPPETEPPDPESTGEENSLAQWQVANAKQWERWQQIIADFEQKEKQRKLEEERLMTQSNERLDRLEALMAAQLEYNRQVAEQATADRQAANERMTRIEQQTAENSQAIQAISRDLAVLVDQQTQTQQGLDRLQNFTTQFIDIMQRFTAEQRQANEAMRQANAELRAGQEQQGQILNMLLRREEERRGGEPTA